MYVSRALLLLTCALALTVVGCGPSVTDDPEVAALLPARVDFNWHIKPLLSDRCFACHGPDDNARKANLRLDLEDHAKRTELKSGGRAIVSGSLRRSAVYRRIHATDEKEMMPPPESNLALSEYERALIAKWIKQGAGYKEHWAFLQPDRPERGKKRGERADGSTWGVNEIDRFVLARLKNEGLEPSDEADKERLLRRVTFDLTGLPPTLDEIDAFLNDRSPDAYERVVDRLLASEAYGERMAMEWMDVSRYADSHGYHADGIRTMWPWRDWVIKAFNENMPFDDFLVWQMAGDLLPNATREQILATGFNRNHPMTAEGGIVDEEYRMEYVFDRTNTTGRAFLGLTVECAQCHDHKYDPFSQKNYYQLAAFFNNLNEVGMTADDRNAGPVLPLPEEDVAAQIAALDSAMASQEAELVRRRGEIGDAGDASMPRLPAALPGLAAHYPLDRLEDERTPNAVRGGEPAHVSGEPELVDGPVGQAVRLKNDFELITLHKTGQYDLHDPFSFALWIRPDEQDHYQEIFGNAGSKNTYWRGYEVYLDSLNRVSARLIHALPHNLVHITTADSVRLADWSHVALTYDGSGRASGLNLYLNGRKQPVIVHHDALDKSILPVDIHYNIVEQPPRVGKSYRAFSGDDGIMRGAFDDIRIYDRALLASEVAFLNGEDVLREALETTPAHQTQAQRQAIADYAFDRGDADVNQLRKDLHRLRLERQELAETVIDVMVMQEMPEPRPTFVLERGLYDAPRERVYPDTPDFIAPMDENLPRNRLGLVRWLVGEENPLTARVTVNRYWQLYFGNGLVATPEDFGSQGSLPTHPELLDWLAIHFRESGWDVKALQKLIVMSATYRQDARATPELRARDPRNELLARGPGHRLAAEMIRDNALAAAGLLVRQVGGESVRPYQPPGLWREKGVFSAALLNYRQDSGPALYRRSMYTFIRRTSPPPMMTAFDVPDRTSCTVRRQNTSTPMQALVLLNDPQFVEASRVLAERMMKEAPRMGPAVTNQIQFAFRLLTGRRARPVELETLEALLEEEMDRFREAPEEALALLSVGEHPRDEALDPVAVAARTMVANTILNFDETYMKR